MAANNGSEITSAKGMLGQVAKENYRIVLFVAHLRPRG